MYSGYLCKKCKNIPLINIVFDDKNNMKLLGKCSCFLKSLTLKQANKYYYTENMRKICPTEIKENEEYKNIIEQLKEKSKIIINKKNELIDFSNNKINEISKTFDKLFEINNDYEKLLNILFNSYKSEPLNNSNKLNFNNIFIRTQELLFNEEKIIKEIKLETTMNYLNTDIQEIENAFSNYLTNGFSQIKRINDLNIIKNRPSIKQILKYPDNFILFRKPNEFNLYSFNSSKIFEQSFYFNKDLIKIDLDRTNIICLSKNSIFILTLKLDIKNEDQKPILNDQRNINIDLFNYYCFELDKNDIDYDNILCLKDENNGNINEGKFALAKKKRIDFYKYNLNLEKKDMILKVFSLDLESKLYKLALIKYKKNHALVIATYLSIFLFDFQKSEKIGEFKIPYDKIDMNQISITQLNQDEIIITKNYTINLFDLKNFKLKLRKNNNCLISHIYRLDDEIFVICDTLGSARYSCKNFESFGQFYFTPGDIENSILLPNNKILYNFCEGNIDYFEIQ